MNDVILVVDDDEQLNEVVAKYLSNNGFRVETETDGLSALTRIRSAAPLLVILDIMLPRSDGLSVCREARKFYQGPILMLTALGDEIDEVAGLETGADDYITKPVQPRLLLARVRALLRRHEVDQVASPVNSTPSGSQAGTQNIITVGKLSLNASARTTTLHGEELRLTSVEFDLLWLLACHAGKVLSRETIYRRLCGREYDGLDRMVDLRVSKLRRKLGDNPDDPVLVKSVRGIGYILAL